MTYMSRSRIHCKLKFRAKKKWIMDIIQENAFEILGVIIEKVFNKKWCIKKWKIRTWWKMVRQNASKVINRRGWHKKSLSFVWKDRKSTRQNLKSLKNEVFRVNKKLPGKNPNPLKLDVKAKKQVKYVFGIVLWEKNKDFTKDIKLFHCKLWKENVIRILNWSSDSKMGKIYFSGSFWWRYFETISWKDEYLMENEQEKGVLKD